MYTPSVYVTAYVVPTTSTPSTMPYIVMRYEFFTPLFLITVSLYHIIYEYEM